MKKIGILGSGMVAQTLASGFLKHGYAVKLGTRNPEKLSEWLSGDGKGAEVGSFADAAAFGDTLVLAAKGSAAKDVLSLAGAENLSGKAILDTTNPIAAAPPEDGVLKYFTSLDRSLMEELQETYPNAHFVKAFNSVGSGRMVDPDFDPKPSMFICGDNDAAKKTTTDILDQFGWETWDLGTSKAARAIEPLAMLWCIPGFRENSWSHAFRMLR